MARHEFEDTDGDLLEVSVYKEKVFLSASSQHERILLCYGSVTARQIAAAILTAADAAESRTPSEQQNVATYNASEENQQWMLW